MKTKTALFALVCLALCLLAACTPDTPSAVAEKYLSALEDGRVRAMADCLEPEAAERLQTYARTLGSETDEVHLINMAPGLSPPPVDDSEVSQMDFEVTEEQIDGDTAWVAAEAEYTTEDDEVHAQELLLTLERRGGRWYISEG
jgi:hypothetical protein